MKKPLKITLISLGSIIAFVLLIFILVTLFAGSIAKSYLNEHAKELIGRKAEVEHIGLNLFSGHVAIEGLKIYEENEKDMFAGFDTLDVSLRLMKLLGSEVYVNHITLAGLDVKVLQKGETFNFTSMLDFFASDSTAEEETDTTPSSWIINLHNIKLSNGKLYYADLERNSHWGLNDLNLIVPDFCIGGSDNTDAGLSLSLADGGLLNVDAAYNAASNDFGVKLDLQNFALNQVKPYVVDMAHVDQIKGRLAVKANVEGNLSQIMNMVIGASVSIDDLAVVDNHEREVASINHIGVDANRVVLSENLFDIKNVTIDGIVARYEMFADSSDTFSRLLKPQPAVAESATSTPDTTPAAPEKPIKLNIGHFELTNTQFTYADHTMPDDFAFPVRNIRVIADNVSLNGTNSAKISAALPNGGSAAINWTGNIDDWKSKQILSLNIKNLHLTDLNPYMVAYLGQPFTEGIFSFTSLNTIHNSNLEGKNRIDIYKPTIGERRKDVKGAMRLPIKAALYILKDKDDKVLLDVPISGNIDSPEFNYMKLVWKTLGNLLVKVATSPARALGDLFNSESGDIFIDIDSHEDDFTSEQFYKIDKAAELAKNDESIILNLELRSLPTDNDTIAANHKRRNELLGNHLTGLGIPAQQFNIIMAEPNANLTKEGYSVTTTVKDLEVIE